MNRSLRRLVALVLLTAALAPLTSALAAPAQADAARSENTTMRAEDGLNPVEARRLRFLFWGYTVIWILLAAYVISISVRLRSVRREMDALRARLGAGRT